MGDWPYQGTQCWILDFGDTYHIHIENDLLNSVMYTKEEIKLHLELDSTMEPIGGRPPREFDAIKSAKSETCHIYTGNKENSAKKSNKSGFQVKLTT